MYSIKNISKNPIIGNMGDGSELRLPVDASITIDKKQMHGYVKTLIDRGELEVINLVARTKDNVEVVKATEELPQKKQKKED